MLEAEPECGPHREVVQPNEPVDPQARPAVVPRGGAKEPPEEAAACVLDAEGADAVGHGAKRERPMPNAVVKRLEQRLREPVHGNVQEAARAASPRVQPDVERVDRPAGEPVDEEALTGGRCAPPRGFGLRETSPLGFYLTRLPSTRTERTAVSNDRRCVHGSDGPPSFRVREGVPAVSSIRRQPS